LSGEVDALFIDAVYAGERLLDTPYARRAGHSGDRQGDGCRPRFGMGGHRQLPAYLRESSNSSPSSRIISSSRPSLNPVGTHEARWPSSNADSKALSPRSTAYDCLTMSTQYWSSSTILRMPLRWPSMVARRFRICFLSLCISF